MASKILVVEPDYNVGQTLAQFLNHHGHVASYCSSAQQAIHAADEKTPGVIILELQLPTHNGIELLYELRSYEDWHNIPVIIYSQIPPAHQAISPMLWENLGVVAYHYKPLAKLTDLLKSVDGILAPTV